MLAHINKDWWRGAVLYQIYPRSFLDTNDDGIGDLPGITQKLDYIADLGVDGIWISPFYPSPMKDFGYDVSDYRHVDPLFGTLSDFDSLLKKAHSLNLKVIIDLVLSHTSNQHPWFSDPSKKEWYVWADPKENNSVPNNWVSVFGGPAWTWNDHYKQYYLHNFLKEQPDLNFHNPDVQSEVLDICRFWLDRGVDGFRLDVVNFYFHDALLRDNPMRTNVVFATQLEADVPYNRQQHVHDKSQPENLVFIKQLRILMDEYPGTMTVGEIGDDDPYVCAQDYTRGSQFLHTSYNTHMMSGKLKELTKDMIRVPVETFANQLDLDEKERSWPSWAFSNHDVVRAASRWFSAYQHDPRLSKMLIALLGCLPGTIFLYQGEELGLPEAEIPFDRLQDPWAKETWPHWQGRDGCRTPMPWNTNQKHCGFSKSEPWLPIPDTHHSLCVQTQNAQTDSTLAFTRKFLNWRKTKAELAQGKCEFKQTQRSKILHFRRYNSENETQCIFNLGRETVHYEGQKIDAFGFHIDGFKDF